MIIEKAPAKINLALHVRARRADGYHEIETLFAFLTDGDEVRLTQGSSGFDIEGPFAADLAADGDNLVMLAVKIFVQKFDLPGEISIALQKNLPIASGIGGGSADAAATLRALARLHDVPLDDRRLIACAETLGSDVPACLLGRSAIGTGRGEQLKPLAGLSGTPVLLVNPRVAVSTATVFSAWDGGDRGPIGNGPLLDRARSGRNDLEAPARVAAPVIGEVLDQLAQYADPMLVRMSGSGATCFALYETDRDRGIATAAIRASRPGWWCLESTLA